MATVAILGGGISGLSCAYYLKTLGKSKIKYLFLLEKGPKFGGWIQTTRFPDGAIFEHGPRSLRIQGKPGYTALSLASQLNLSDDVVPIHKNHPAAQSRLIYAKNKLYPLPSGVWGLLRTSPPFSKPLYRAILKDFTSPKVKLSDESVYSFVDRRLGKELADYVSDPMVRGVSGGDAREISIRSLLPNIFLGEQQHGSIIQAIIHEGKKNANIDAEFLNSDLVIRARQEAWRMWNLKNGLGQLVDTLACAIEEEGVADLHFNAECTALTFKENKALVTVDNEVIEVDHVFATIPALKLAPLLQSYPLLSEQLASIMCVTLAVVYLEYDGFAHKYDAFGFLTPSIEDSKVLGIVFDSCCFPQHNGMSRTRITCMIGGRWFEELFGNPDTVTEDEMLQVAVQEAKRHLQISMDPVRYRVVIQQNCIPQYVIGHHQKLETIREQVESNGLCLSVVGASYDGSGVPDCIYNSKNSVEKYLKTINEV